MCPRPGPEDLRYLSLHFVLLGDLARAHGRELTEVAQAIAAGLLPKPAYVLEGNRELVAPDFFALTEAAGGDEKLPGWFAAAYAAAAAHHPEADPVDEAWQEYLTGVYATCLRSVTPGTIVRKAVLMAEIEALIAAARPQQTEWLVALRRAVDALDALEREFAEIDRLDGPVSRDRLITAPKASFPEAWADGAATAGHPASARRA